MSNETVIYTRKELKKLIRNLKNQQQSVFSYAPGSEFYKEVIGSLGNSPMFLIDEIINENIKAVIDEDSRIELEKQPDFFGYSEKLIKLPEKQAVKVEVATLDHMLIQQDLLVQNHYKQIRAFLRHHDGIIVPIIRTMKEMNLLTAGEALKVLQEQGE
jgi:hypothetical protein